MGFTANGKVTMIRRAVSKKVGDISVSQLVCLISNELVLEFIGADSSKHCDVQAFGNLPRNLNNVRY